MAADRHARAEAARTAIDRALSAVSWLADAQESALEVNGDAAYARRIHHARAKLTEALAAIEIRPAQPGAGLLQRVAVAGRTP